MIEVNRPTARVVVQSRSLRSLRWSLSLTRWVLYAAAAAGVAATVRFAVAPPTARAPAYRSAAVNDPAAEWFAQLFARAYLSWGPDVAEREQSLAPFLGRDDDPDAGAAPAPGSDQQIASTGIAAARIAGDGAYEYTVAAQTANAGVIYLDVNVARVALGRYVLTSYPAIVGPPAMASAGPLNGPELPIVTNPALKVVLERALRNYLDGSTLDLHADLAEGASVASPNPALLLQVIQRLAVESSSVILATLVARDRAGTSYTLDYSVRVTSGSGRWEISSIEPMTNA